MPAVAGGGPTGDEVVEVYSNSSSAPNSVSSTFLRRPSETRERDAGADDAERAAAGRSSAAACFCLGASCSATLASRT